MKSSFDFLYRSKLCQDPVREFHWRECFRLVFRSQWRITSEGGKIESADGKPFFIEAIHQSRIAESNGSNSSIFGCISKAMTFGCCPYESMPSWNNSSRNSDLD